MFMGKVRVTVLSQTLQLSCDRMFLNAKSCLKYFL